MATRFELFIPETSLRTARNLCAGAGTYNPEYVRGVAEFIIDMTWSLNQNADKDDLIAYLGAPDENSPATDGQRRALFASFNEVFGHSDSEGRYAFSRLVLGKPSDAIVSWARNNPGALTVGEASKVLDALNLLNV